MKLQQIFKNLFLRREFQKQTSRSFLGIHQQPEQALHLGPRSLISALYQLRIYVYNHQITMQWQRHGVRHRDLAALHIEVHLSLLRVTMESLELRGTFLSSVEQPLQESTWEIQHLLHTRFVWLHVTGG